MKKIFEDLECDIKRNVQKMHIPNSDKLVELYGSSKSNISEHIKHIFEEGELDKNSVVRNFRTTAKDGKHYNVKYYNLKMIIAIGYRVRSNIGTNFRKWANKVLKEYLLKGYAINETRSSRRVNYSKI